MTVEDFQAKLDSVVNRYIESAQAIYKDYVASIDDLAIQSKDLPEAYVLAALTRAGQRMETTFAELPIETD